MFDFLKKFNLDWTPADIENDTSNFEVENIQQSSEINIEDIQIAQRLCEHLNLIKDYQDRLDSIDYLAKEAKTNFDNISFTSVREDVVNAIASVGGKDGTVDFVLIQDVIDILIDYMDKTALEAITGEM